MLTPEQGAKVKADAIVAIKALNRAEGDKHRHTQVKYNSSRHIAKFDCFLHDMLREAVRFALNKRLPIQMFVTKGPYPKDRADTRALAAAALYSVLKEDKDTHKHILAVGPENVRTDPGRVYAS